MFININKTLSTALVICSTWTLLACRLSQPNAVKSENSSNETKSESKSDTKSDTSDQIVVLGLIKVQEGKQDAFKMAVKKLVTATKSESGSLIYDFHQAFTASTDFASYEKWANEAAAKDHSEKDYMKDFLKEVGPMLAATPVITKFKKIEAP